jgi:hypothetical protein
VYSRSTARQSNKSFFSFRFPKINRFSPHTKKKKKYQKGPRGGMGEGGYVTEFVDSVWKPLMKQILKKKIKLVTNAGGMNPIALKEKIEQVTKEAGLEVPIIAAVVGDDLLPQKDQLREGGHFKNFSLVGEVDPFPPEDKPMMSCNAYIGAVPIARALAEGAQIVVTGMLVVLIFFVQSAHIHPERSLKTEKSPSS